MQLRPIDLGRSFEKHRALRRAIDEIDYGFRSARQLWRVRPDHVVAAQLPVLSLLILTLTAKLARTPLTLWLQDIQSEIARSQSHTIGAALARLEGRALRMASNVITISDGMADATRELGANGTIHVVENWADIGKIAPGSKANEWAAGHGLDRTINFLYSGTLGIKHRPEALAALASDLEGHEHVRIVVVSQGAGTEKLRSLVQGLGNVVLLPLQPAERLPEVLATADVFLAMLEEDAADGCVPSKILAYAAAGRPTLALFPQRNLAAQIINERAESGFAVESQPEFLAAAEKLLSSRELRTEQGERARAYAEFAFDIGRKADSFEAIINNSQENRA